MDSTCKARTPDTPPGQPHGGPSLHPGTFRKGATACKLPTVPQGPSVTFLDILKMSIEISAYILTEVCICL